MATIFPKKHLKFDNKLQNTNFLTKIKHKNQRTAKCKIIQNNYSPLSDIYKMPKELPLTILRMRRNIKNLKNSQTLTILTNEREWKEEEKTLRNMSFTGTFSNKNSCLLNAKQSNSSGDYCQNILLENNFSLSNKTDNRNAKSKCLLTSVSKAVIAVHESIENLELKEIIIKDNKVEIFENNINAYQKTCVNDTFKKMSDELKSKPLNLMDNKDEASVKNEFLPSTTTITTIARPISLNTCINKETEDLKSPLPLKSSTNKSTTDTPISVQHQIHNCSKSKHPYAFYNSKALLSTVTESNLIPKTPPVTPDSPSTYLDDDIDSVYSYLSTTSGRSTMSCEHPYVARNGTTFSGRKMKYVVHCSSYAGQVGPDYLTPTQRAQRQVRRLRELLCIARQELEFKDSEILHLTREVVELRLFKASLSSPDERSLSSDAVTVREAELKTSQDVSPIVDMVDDLTKSSPRHTPYQNKHHNNQQNIMLLSSEMQSSFADSGHFEDISVHSQATHDVACGNDEVIDRIEKSVAENYEKERQDLINSYEKKIDDLIRNHETASSELKHSYNERVELLLQKLGDWNSRYAEIVPDYEHAKERIRELESELDNLQQKLAEQDQQQNKMYLHIYQKEQEAEKIARADKALELDYRESKKISLSELLHELQSTQNELENIRESELKKECGGSHALLTAKEAVSLWVLGARKTIYRRLLEARKTRTHMDPEITLQFLKSAIYYFLTDKENSQGHLQAIESILEFTEIEKRNIDNARFPK